MAAITNTTPPALKEQRASELNSVILEEFFDGRFFRPDYSKIDDLIKKNNDLLNVSARNKFKGLEFTNTPFCVFVNGAAHILAATNSRSFATIGPDDEASLTKIVEYCLSKGASPKNGVTGLRSIMEKHTFPLPVHVRMKQLLEKHMNPTTATAAQPSFDSNTKKNN
jgi:hypothetical protein